MAQMKKNFFTPILAWFRPTKNRRRFKRVHVPFLVKYKVEEAGQGAITNVRDLSVGGVLFTSDQPILIGSKLKLELNLPTSEKPMSVLAKVIRVAKLKQAQVFRVATSFVSLQPSDRTAIRHLIERMARDRRVKGLVNRKKRIWTAHAPA